MNLQTVNTMDVGSTQTLYLELWKLEISAANDAFIHGRHPQAFSHYEAALGLAQTGVDGLMAAQEVLNLLAEAERQIAALVVTRHNLADLYRQSGQLDKAIAHLCDAHETLFQLFHHPHGDIRELAQRHLRVTYQEIVGFTQRHGQQARIQQSLFLTQYVCECCRQKVEH